MSGRFQFDGGILPTVTAMLLSAIGCTTGDRTAQQETPVWPPLDSVRAFVLAVDGFAEPKSVRYDPAQDQYFVANANGGDRVRDGNGFISRVSADGTVLDRRFAVGTSEQPLHAPQGLFIVGDTLWVVDLEALHAFDRTDGRHLRSVDLSALGPGRLDDVARGPEGSLYVTDPGRSRIYRVTGDQVAVAIAGPGLGEPRGIAWDEPEHHFVLAPWQADSLIAWDPDSVVVTVIGASPGGLRNGIELVGTRLLVGSQIDSTIQVVSDGTPHALIKLLDRTADFGIDTVRRRIAIPLPDRGRVEVWQLPSEG